MAFSFVVPRPERGSVDSPGAAMVGRSVVRAHNALNRRAMLPLDCFSVAPRGDGSFVVEFPSADPALAGSLAARHLELVGLGRAPEPTRGGLTRVDDCMDEVEALFAEDPEIAGTRRWLDLLDSERIGPESDAVIALRLLRRHGAGETWRAAYLSEVARAREERRRYTRAYHRGGR